jgi:hypothetical protein
MGCILYFDRDTIPRLMTGAKILESIDKAAICLMDFFLCTAPKARNFGSLQTLQRHSISHG